MKRFAKGAYASSGIGFIILILCVLGCKKATQKLFAIEQITTNIDSNLSPATQENIRHAIFELTSTEKKIPANQCNIALNARLLTEKLREQFPCIKTVSIAYTPSNKAHITLTAQIPKFCIDTQFVTTENGVLINKEDFSPYATQHLRAISIALDEKTTELPSTCKACLASLSPAILDQYEFSWKSSSHAWLHDKNTKKFSILFSDKSVPNTDLLNACAVIKKNITNREIAHMKSKNRWVADIRFKNQIVVFTQRGG